MEKKEDPPPPQIPDSDRAALDEWKADKEYARRVAAEKKARIEQIKAWVTFGTAVLVLKGIVWEQLKVVWDFIVSHAK